MKIYQIVDRYRNKEYFRETKEKANFIASLWESELDLREIKNAGDFIHIYCLNGKNDILDILNKDKKY